MKILVFPHHLEIGGSQTNAIDIATAVRERHGHEVLFFATPGPGSALLAERGFELVVAPAAGAGGSSRRVGPALARVVADRGVDLVHAWDWPQCLAAFGTQLSRRTPVLGSIMSMAVLRFLPLSMPMTYGTPELVDRAGELGARSVALLEPPVDTVRDDPALVSGAAYRQRYRVADDELAVVVVSRLVSWLKLEGLHRAIDAVAALSGLPVRLLIVGEGPAAAELATHGRAVNASAGREVVTLTGAELDPRAAYAAADVILGMGGSVLRGMAFGKPAIVLGEHGFSSTFDEVSAPGFLYRGLYGTGAGRSAPDPLREQLRRLLTDEALRRQLAGFSRTLVVQRYALTAAADSVAGLYATVSTAPRPRLLVDASRTLALRSAARLRQGIAPRVAA